MPPACSKGGLMGMDWGHAQLVFEPEKYQQWATARKRGTHLNAATQ